MEIYSLLILTHVVGAVLGVGSATFIEIHTIHALHQGVRDPMKTTIMQISYNVLRIGLLLSVLSGMGFLVYARLLEFTSFAERPLFWLKMSILVVIVATAMLQQLRVLPLTLGSALSFTSWYTVLALGVFLSTAEDVNIALIVLIYLLAIAGMYFVFSSLHRRFSRNKESATD